MCNNSVANPIETIKAEGAAALEQALDTIEGVTSGLEDEVAAESEADQAFIEALSGSPVAAESAPTLPTASVPPEAGRDYSSPARIGEPEDPPGWERIYEGSFLEAALVTQLSGDFPGPVLAVANQDQSRLAVSFHRLILPDGRWVSLDFHGLNQVGEGALKDRVDRHYFSMFAAVGAVGVLSGLTAARGNPYEGGVAGFRARGGAGTRPSRYAHPGSFLESSA